MRLGILGPLLVADDGGNQVMVSAPRQRALLAALLVRANRTVPVEELAELVWDAAPPDGAARTVRSYVVRLRRVVGPAVAARIVTRDPGYRCEVAEDELDMLRFEALCRCGGAAVRGRAWQRARELLAEALGLWRGALLEDIASQALRRECAEQLEQARLRALEWRIEADLHLGRHEELIPELQALACGYPLREHGHAQLILALYRCGRVAEALDAFQRARRVLVRELGVEPGPELRALQEKILAGDAALAEPPQDYEPEAAVGRVLAVIPRQLPPAAGRFTGRAEELRILSELSARIGQAGDTVVISAIGGMAGVGKTTLAVHWAHQVADRFPDGQLFIDLHGYTQASEPRSAGEVLEAFLRALGVALRRIPEDVEERAALFRQRLAGTRTLILLDNAISEGQVRPLLPGAPGCLVLITSRRRLKGLDDAYVLALDVLPQADALELLRAVAGPERAAAEDPLLAEIVELCGRLPLALRIAGALLRHRPAWSPEHLAGLLRGQRHRIRMLSDGERDLGAVLDLSYRSLTPAQQSLFRSLGLLPGPDLDAYAAAALTGTDPADAAFLLEALVDQNLLIQHVPGRYRPHDLIRLHAKALTGQDPAHDRHSAFGRLLEYYQHTAGRADALIARAPRAAPDSPALAHTPLLPDPDAARAWLRTERPNLLAAARYTISHAYGEYAIALLAGLSTLLRADGPWIEAIYLYGAAAATAESLGDLPGQASALTLRGDLRALTGNLPDAIRDLEKALQICRGLGDRLGQANALTRLGDVRGLTGNFQDAVRDLDQALQLYRDLGERHGQANALGLLGERRRVAGDLPGAVRNLEEALQLFREVDDRHGQANALSRLGDVRRIAGDFLHAIRDLEGALKLFRDLGERNGQAYVLTWLGEMRRVAGDFPNAISNLEQALHLFRELGEPLGQAGALTWLGRARLSAGDRDGAARHLEEALGLSRRLGARGGEAWTLNHYAAVFIAASDFARARALYQDALHLARQTRQLDDEALALEGIGECYLRTADTESGIAYLRQALEIFERTAMKPDTGRVRASLARLSGPA
jgi:DNA-binding SARP family transcriptional activator